MTARHATRRASFQFCVSGHKQSGTIYVTLNYDPSDEDAAIVKATALASKRSGDPNPRFVRIEGPRR